MTAASRTVVAVRRVLLIAAVAGLLLGVGQQPPVPGGPPERLHVVLAVDRTTSMAALDGDDEGTPRLAVVVRDLLGLVEALPGARFSLVTFGQEGTLRVPFTPDAEVLGRALTGLTVEMPQVGDGSRVDAGRALVGEQVQRAERSAVPPEEVRTAVVYVGDGENTAPDEPSGFGGVGRATDAALVLGYGTADGAPMPLDPSRVLPFDDDSPDPATLPTIPAPDGSGAGISRLDTARLERIADELGGPFVHRRAGVDIATLAAELEQRATTRESLPPRPGRDLGWLWALSVLVLVLPELAGWVRALMGTRQIT